MLPLTECEVHTTKYFSVVQGVWTERCEVRTPRTSEPILPVWTELLVNKSFIINQNISFSVQQILPWDTPEAEEGSMGRTKKLAYSW